MRHPNRKLRRQSLKKLRVGLLDLDLGMPILAFRSGAHFAAEGIDHELQSIADTEHGEAKLEDTFVGVRSVLVIDRRWTARQNNPDGMVAANLFERGIEGENDREDFLFADAARNQLRILRAKVKDNDRLGFH